MIVDEDASIAAPALASMTVAADVEGVGAPSRGTVVASFARVEERVVGL